MSGITSEVTITSLHDAYIKEAEQLEFGDILSL